MLTTALILSLVCGVILCFFGYRSFRLAMTVAGSVMGGAIGYFIYGLVSEYLPVAESGLWVLVFMAVGGILLGFLSYRIYKAALFYITMFSTAFLILKVFLLTAGSGIGVTAFLMVLLGKTSVGGAADALTDIPLGKGGTIGTAVSAAIAKLPGSTPTEHFWIVFGAAVAVGAIAGLVVVILQKPAIIAVTSALGGILITQGLFSLYSSFQAVDMKAETFVATIAAGSGQTELETLVTAAFLLAGIYIQFRTTKKL